MSTARAGGAAASNASASRRGVWTEDKDEFARSTGRARRALVLRLRWGAELGCRLGVRDVGALVEGDGERARVQQEAAGDRSAAAPRRAGEEPHLEAGGMRVRQR